MIIRTAAWYPQYLLEVAEEAIWELLAQEVDDDGADGTSKEEEHKD
jgi:hypothetical protein